MSFAGDLERKLVAGVRLGPGAEGMPLKFVWYKDGKPIGSEGHIILNSGDIYVMSEKAVGFDWKRRTIPTLRHAAGKASCKYARIKRKRGDAEPPVVILSA